MGENVTAFMFSCVCIQGAHSPWYARTNHWSLWDLNQISMISVGFQRNIKKTTSSWGSNNEWCKKRGKLSPLSEFMINYSVVCCIQTLHCELDNVAIMAYVNKSYKLCWSYTRSSFLENIGPEVTTASYQIPERGGNNEPPLLRIIATVHTYSPLSMC